MNQRLDEQSQIQTATLDADEPPHRSQADIDELMTRFRAMRVRLPPGETVADVIRELREERDRRPYLPSERRDTAPESVESILGHLPEENPVLARLSDEELAAEPRDKADALQRIDELRRRSMLSRLIPADASAERIIEVLQALRRRTKIPEGMTFTQIPHEGRDE